MKTYMYMTRMQTSMNIYSLQVFHVHSKIPWLQFKCLHHNHINWTQDLRICQSTNQNVLTVEKRLRRFNEIPIVQFCLSEDTTKNRGSSQCKNGPRYSKTFCCVEVMAMTVKHYNKQYLVNTYIHR